MIGNNVIVTGADDRYFELASELIRSARRFNQTIHFAIIDSGLSAHNIALLHKDGVKVIQPYSPAFLEKRGLGRERHARVNISKVWLDQMLPEYDRICWIDADAWVQQKQALENLFGAATDGKIGIVPEIGAKKTDLLRIRWLMFGFSQIRSFLYKNACKAKLPMRLRTAIGGKATLNAGVFCLETKSPSWEVFRKWQKVIVTNGGSLFTQDQLSIALSVYIDNCPIAFLDNGHNYLGPWIFDKSRDALVNLFYPHDPVGIIHMASQAAVRKSLANTIAVQTLDGQVVQKNIRYAALVEHPQCAIKLRLCEQEPAPQRAEVELV